MLAQQEPPVYEPPSLCEIGSIADLTLAPCKPKHYDLVPDHVLAYLCDDGSVIVVSSA